ncbi:MAG: hypothetical protein IJT95_05335 [Abditibacteriota bacterium]|nr:hypothetical protein [Abditibacteriota bacterium]
MKRIIPVIILVCLAILSWALFCGCSRSARAAQAVSALSKMSGGRMPGYGVPVPKPAASKRPSYVPLMERKDVLEAFEAHKGNFFITAGENGWESSRDFELPEIVRSDRRRPDFRVYSVRSVIWGGLERNTLELKGVSTQWRPDGPDFIRIKDPYPSEDSDHFAWLYLDPSSGFRETLNKKTEEPLKDGLTLTRLDIEKEARKYTEDHDGSVPGDFIVFQGQYKSDLELLTDGAGRLLWISSTDRLLSAEKQRDRYALLTTKGVAFVYPGSGGSAVVDLYDQPLFPSLNRGSAPVLGIKSGRLLKDDVARVEYDSGLVVHWRLIEKYSDHKNNADKGRFPYAAILWHNGKADIYEHHLAWDHDPDTAREPAYK